MPPEAATPKWLEMETGNQSWCTGGPSPGIQASAVLFHVLGTQLYTHVHPEHFIAMILLAALSCIIQHMKDIQIMRMTVIKFDRSNQGLKER